MFSVLANVKLSSSALPDNNYSDHRHHTEYWCASNIKLAHARCLQIAFQILPLQIQVEKYSKNISRILQLLYSGRGMKPLHWRPSHSTFHLLNWSLERSFGGYLVQICSGWGRGRKSPGLVSSISIPATSSWWWGRGAVGERGVALTKNKWEQIDF